MYLLQRFPVTLKTPEKKRNQMSWNISDRAAALRLYHREGSVVAAQRAIRLELGRRNAPGRHTLLRWAAAFEQRGSVTRAPHYHPGLRVPRSLLRRIRRAIARKPRVSIRALVTRTGLSRSTVHRVLRHYLGLFPFKLQLVQHLRRGDKAKRKRFCTWALEKWRSPGFRNGLLMTDEAVFVNCEQTQLQDLGI